jgi:mannose-6-phosphate isomerase-like protein (cupin superfamily)
MTYVHAHLCITKPRRETGRMDTTSHRRRFDASQGPRKIDPTEGESVELLSIGVRFMAWTEETGGGFSLVEHPIRPRTLAAPLHKHTREDEYSYVVTGRMGALLGGDTVYADAGDFVFKPRDQWHAFWNAGDEPCHILEIISPGGFEHYFNRALLQRARDQDGLAGVRPGGARRARCGVRPRVGSGEHSAPVREVRPDPPFAGGGSRVARRTTRAAAPGCPGAKGSEPACYCRTASAAASSTALFTL